jgi:phosphopantothenoylcysteine synthetase/decarboxylase
MRILITAGGTREYIDPVRFISNASSGRMGYELAQAAIKAGHKITLITTVDRKLHLTKRATIVKVETAAEMFEAVKKNFLKCDCLIMAAAVADYTPAKKSKLKLKKQDNDLIIKLKPTADIVKWAGNHKCERLISNHKSRIIVGFALEDKNLLRNAEKKLKEKKLDMIVANSLPTIGSDKTTVYFKTPESAWQSLKNKTKAAIANKIINLASKFHCAQE